MSWTPISRELFFFLVLKVSLVIGVTPQSFHLSSLDNNFFVIVMAYSQPASKVCFMKFARDQWSVTYTRLKEPPHYPLSLW